MFITFYPLPDDFRLTATDGLFFAFRHGSSPAGKTNISALFEAEARW